MNRTILFSTLFFTISIVTIIGSNEGRAERTIVRELLLTKVERNLMYDCKRGLRQTDARFSEGATPTSGCACIAKAINHYPGKFRIFARDTMFALFTLSRKTEKNEITRVQDALYEKSLRLSLGDSDVVQIIGTMRNSMEACGRMRPVVTFRPKLNPKANKAPNT